MSGLSALQTSFSALTLSSAIGTILAGAVNGALLQTFLVGSTLGFLNVAGLGLLAYAITTLVSRLITIVFDKTKRNQNILDVNWFNLIVAGSLNGLVFVALSAYTPAGMVGGIIAGAIAFYFLSFLTWIMSVGN